MPRPDVRRRRVERAVFATLLGAYAYFHQGGGWNQNARLAQVRAVVEQRTFAINDYLVYRHKGRGQLLERQRIPPGTAWETVANQASSADVLVGPQGLIFPNKPPGTLIVTAPTYAVALGLERAVGADPDRWAVLTANAHLVTLLSVGLAGALTAVLLLRVTSRLFPDLPLAAHAAAALTCGLGTLMLPFSTVLFDHVLVAFWLLLAFAALIAGGPDRGHAPLAGVSAGLACVTNYMAAPVAGLLLLYLAAQRRWRHTLGYVAGLVLPLIALAAYQAACFENPLALAKPYDIPLADTRGPSLFSWPSPAVLWQVLAGMQRGLLVTSPVMAMAAVGLVLAWRGGRRAEVALATGGFLCFWLFNATFSPSPTAWQGGWSLGPRYLIPAIPFLCLGLAPAFARLPRTTTAVAALSAALLLLATSVDVQPPRRARDPLRDYVWPLWRGRTVRLHEDVEITDPVSANPIGVYEGSYYRVFGPTSRAATWNSYNMGELLWPQSRLSLLPLALWLGAGLFFTLAWSRADRSAGEEPPPSRP